MRAKVTATPPVQRRISLEMDESDYEILKKFIGNFSPREASNATNGNVSQDTFNQMANNIFPAMNAFEK